MMEVNIYLMQQRPAEVLAIFDETIHPMHQETEIMAQAYQIMGKNDKANEATQISIYQHLLFVLNSSLQFITLNMDKPEKAKEILRRTLSLAQLYDVDSLHPNTMALTYLTAAQVYCIYDEQKKALQMLESYANVCTTTLFPCTLHGDDYFDAIDNWIKDFDLGNAAPRNDDVIKNSVLQGITANPAFTPLVNTPEYKNIINKLKTKLGVN